MAILRSRNGLGKFSYYFFSLNSNSLSNHWELVIPTGGPIPVRNRQNSEPEPALMLTVTVKKRDVTEFKECLGM